jgi:hypothetical protein
VRNSAKPLQLMPGGASRSAPETRFARELPTVPLSPSEGERVGEGVPLPWNSGSQSASNCRGVLSRLHCPDALDPAR